MAGAHDQDPRRLNRGTMLPDAFDYPMQVPEPSIAAATPSQAAGPSQTAAPPQSAWGGSSPSGNFGVAPHMSHQETLLETIVREQQQTNEQLRRTVRSLQLLLILVSLGVVGTVGLLAWSLFGLY